MKWIWITGASSGIGKALAIDFAKQGNSVIISARNEAKLNELKAFYPEQIHVLPLDVCNSEARIKAIKSISEITNSLDFFVHSAGMSQRSLAEETPVEIVKSLFELNFFGLIELNRLALPLLKPGARVVVISSLVGKFSTPFRTAYSASKHALDGYFEGLRYEWKSKKIGITMVYPGYIKTDISINAIKADGSQHGIMDKNQAFGILPETCSAYILKKLEKNKDEIIVGKTEVYGLYLKRFFPSLLRRIVRSKNLLTLRNEN